MSNADQASLSDMVSTAMGHDNAGRLAEAEECYRRITKLKPDWADLHNNLGSVLQRQGKLGQAADSYQYAVRLDPQNAIAHFNLGYILNIGGEFDEAAEHYKHAIALKPTYAEARCNLGNILLQKGRVDQAIDEYNAALSIEPNYAEAHNNLGNALKAQSKLEEAAEWYRRAIALKPDYADAYNNLGSVCHDQGRLDDAVACYEQSLGYNPNHAEAHCNLGLAFKELGKIEKATQCFQRAIALKPDYAAPNNNMVGLLKDQGRLEEASHYVDRALALSPGFAAAHCNRGSLLQDQGRLEEAAADFRRAIALKPGYPEAHYNLAQLKTFRPDDTDLADLRSLAADAGHLPVSKRPYIHFAFAKALEDIGDYPGAFEQLLAGNRIKRQSLSYDEVRTRQYFRQIIATFDAALLERCAGGGDPSATPIFVLGMPRSGSTLIEQILSSHPQIHGAGELTTLSLVANSLRGTRGQALSYPESCLSLDPELARSMGADYLRRLPQLPPGKIRMTDKMPGNFAYVGLIHVMLPNARIIHTVRDPIDTCVSCFSKLFAAGMPCSYDLGELGRYYRWYDSLMDHWRSILPPNSFLEVSYEKLIDDLEGQSRQLIEYIGLGWDPACLNFHENARPVSTASNVRVRQRLSRSSVGRWRRYWEYLQPLLTELNRPRGLNQASNETWSRN